MPLVTRRRPFQLNTIHPSVLGDTHSAWFGRKWVGTRRERVLFNRAKWGGGSNNYMLQQTSGDTHSAWFGRKWVGTRQERVLFNWAKGGWALIRCNNKPV
jgi:hypothetical protein